ncbi:hypothetical protein [Solidesulfovibrio magneticus]|uniref:Uncharacterized protein n=1 Tax=Solidesulfovibrio magneticus (strain ATCC 700980 / DSM 13731 / RS-1) TaxID=573370 RepID=C4XM60_SOLM1|nr:hypothetical protein [Solidesulfovibrio magneticus]BAH77188.1 hypothetical protein DMR_36970 [Solidesulfovibrio magneticus RS-1]
MAEFDRFVEEQYRAAGETVQLLKDIKNPSRLNSLTKTLRKQCLDDHQVLEIGDVAVAIHDQIQFLVPSPFDMWIKKQYLPTLDEVKPFVKVKKEGGEVIRKLFSIDGEKCFYAIAIVYCLEMHDKNFVVEVDYQDQSDRDENISEEVEQDEVY